jgi:hypothetical protein
MADDASTAGYAPVTSGPLASSQATASAQGGTPGYDALLRRDPALANSPVQGYEAVPGYEGEPVETTAPPVFDLRFAVEADDAYDASPSVQQLIRWFIVVAVVIAVAFLLLALVRSTLDAWTIGAAVLLVVGALLLAPVARWFVRQQSRSLEGMDAAAMVNAWGLHFEGPFGRQDIPWSSLTDVTEAGRVILFQYDTIPVAYLPRRSFASVQQEKSAIAFARKSIAMASSDITDQQG